MRQRRHGDSGVHRDELEPGGCLTRRWTLPPKRLTPCVPPSRTTAPAACPTRTCSPTCSKTCSRPCRGRPACSSRRPRPGVPDMLAEHIRQQMPPDAAVQLTAATLSRAAGAGPGGLLVGDGPVRRRPRLPGAPLPSTPVNPVDPATGAPPDGPPVATRPGGVRSPLAAGVAAPDAWVSAPPPTLGTPAPPRRRVTAPAGPGAGDLAPPGWRVGRRRLRAGYRRPSAAPGRRMLLDLGRGSGTAAAHAATVARRHGCAPSTPISLRRRQLGAGRPPPTPQSGQPPHPSSPESDAHPPRQVAPRTPWFVGGAVAPGRDHRGRRRGARPVAPAPARSPAHDHRPPHDAPVTTEPPTTGPTDHPGRHHHAAALRRQRHVRLRRHHPAPAR